MPLLPDSRGGAGASTRTIWRNLLQLLTGRVAAALITLAATVVMARALAAEAFGLVVTIHAYILLVRGVCNAKASETVVRFGVALLDGGDGDRLGELLGFVRGLEWITMLVATAAAILLAPLAGLWLGWTDRAVLVAQGCSLALLLSAVGTFRGYLRLTNQFDILKVQLLVGPLVRLAGVLLAAWAGGTWPVFAAVWALALGAGYAYLWWRGRRAIRDGGVQFRRLPWRRLPLRFPGLPGFMHAVYWQSTLDQLQKTLPLLLAGGWLGAVGAGHFRVARDLADVLSKPAALVRQAALTDMTRLGSLDRPGLNAALKHLASRIGGLAGSVVLLALVGGGWLLEQLFGGQYRAAHTLLWLLLLAAAVELTGSALRPAAYALDQAARVLHIETLAALVYFSALVVLLPGLGLLGAGLASCAWALLVFGLLLGLVRSRLR